MPMGDKCEERAKENMGNKKEKTMMSKELKSVLKLLTERISSDHARIHRQSTNTPDPVALLHTSKCIGLFYKDHIDPYYLSEKDGFDAASRWRVVRGGLLLGSSSATTL